MKKFLYGFILFSLLLFNQSAFQAQDKQQLIVFAAASLTDSFEAIAEEFEIINPNVDVLFNFSGSSTLATQLIQGAPADIFASANPNQIHRVAEFGFIDGEPVTFVQNRLVVIVPIDNPADIQSLHDLANSDINLILGAPEVPVRTYTDTLFERLSNDIAYGADYLSAVLQNLVSEEPNVRQIVAKVTLGEADAGIVYSSDINLKIADFVVIIPIPDKYNIIAEYPIAVTDDSNQPDLAQKFIDFVLSDTGQDILVEWGFDSILTTQPSHDEIVSPCGIESYWSTRED